MAERVGQLARICLLKLEGQSGGRACVKFIAGIRGFRSYLEVRHDAGYLNLKGHGFRSHCGRVIC
jgi:hypothetical protein